MIKRLLCGSLMLRNLLTCLLGFIFCITNVVIVCGSEAETSIPPMPEGYSSELMIKAAFMLNQIKLVDAKNVIVPENVVEQKDIEYGKAGDKSLQLDLYSPKKMDKPAPGIIFIHGGGWTSGHRRDMKFYTVNFAKRGYVCATVSYRLAGEALFPAAVQDVKCAVRWMCANAKKYNIDPDKIVVSGNSAGGYLALMTGYSSDVPELECDSGNVGVSSRPQAVINFYGPVDLTTDFARKKSLVVDFLGKSYDEDPKLHEFASPISHLTKDDPPTLILHGTIDSTVPIKQADMLADKLKSFGIDYLYEKYEGWPHTMDLAEAVNQRCQYQMVQFLEKHLK